MLERGWVLGAGGWQQRYGNLKKNRYPLFLFKVDVGDIGERMKKYIYIYHP